MKHYHEYLILIERAETIEQVQAALSDVNLKWETLDTVNLSVTQKRAKEKIRHYFLRKLTTLRLPVDLVSYLHELTRLGKIENMGEFVEACLIRGLDSMIGDNKSYNINKDGKNNESE